jgi:hypothetical protein
MITILLMIRMSPCPPDRAALKRQAVTIPYPYTSMLLVTESALTMQREIP